MTAALTASPPAYLCVRCNAPWQPGAERCAECERRAANTPEAQVADLRAQLAAVTAERDALRAIVEGRTAPPTAAEAEAHAAAGGLWRWVVTGDGEPLRGRCGDGTPWPDADPIGSPRRIGVVYSARWWALDSQRRPCRWPTTSADGSDR